MTLFKLDKYSRQSKQTEDKDFSLFTKHLQNSVLPMDLHTYTIPDLRNFKKETT